MPSDERPLLARAWDEAAAGYEDYVVPRFAPWVADAARALAGVELPPGPIVIPCCGTLPELPLLLDVQPGREFVGVDLSAVMVRMARDRAANAPGVRVVEGDASSLRAVVPDGAAAVVSVFGLQLLPDPVAAMADWGDVLVPGGTLSVVFWPLHTEDDGPFALMRRVFADKLPPRAADWEPRLVPALTSAGLTIERDDLVAHPMTHPDAAIYWSAVTEGGAQRALAIERGPEFMAAVREEFLAQAPSGPWTHRPQARHIVASS